MPLLNILLQIIIGICLFITIYLDYIQSDKRTNKFKSWRKYLLYFTIAAVILAILVQIKDHRDNELKERNYQAKLEGLKDSLTSVKIIATDLRIKMDPIIALAQSKYPKMSTIDAIKQLENDLDSLQFRTGTLEERNRNIERRKAAFERLKRTKPKFECDLKLENDNGVLYLTILFEFQNRVPIVYRPSIENFENLDIKPVLFNKLPECNPNDEIGMSFKYKYSKLDELRYVKGYYNIITMKVPYQSKYYEEIDDKNLAGEIVKEYILDLTVPRLTELKN